MHRIRVRKRRQCSSENVRPRRIYNYCPNDETKRHEPEHGNTFLDHTKRALPYQEPDDEGGRHGPPLKINSGSELECNADAANLRRQDQQTHERQYDVEKCKVVEAKPLANRVGNRAPANCGEAARLFDEKNDAEAAEQDRPDQLKRKISTGLSRRCDRSDLKEPADARDDAERDLHDLFHGASSRRSRRAARRSASRSQPAKSARPAIT